MYVNPEKNTNSINIKIVQRNNGELKDRKRRNFDLFLFFFFIKSRKNTRVYVACCMVEGSERQVVSRKMMPAAGKYSWLIYYPGKTSADSFKYEHVKFHILPRLRSENKLFIKDCLFSSATSDPNCMILVFASNHPLIIYCRMNNRLSSIMSRAQGLKQKETTTFLILSAVMGGYMPGHAVEI